MGTKKEMLLFQSELCIRNVAHDTQAHAVTVRLVLQVFEPVTAPGPLDKMGAT